MRHILVIGAGRSASSLIKYLLDHSEAQNLHVTIGDLSEELAKQIVANKVELGSDAMLAAYRASRSNDTKNGLMFTDFLVNIFSTDGIGSGKSGFEHPHSKITNMNNIFFIISFYLKKLLN